MQHIQKYFGIQSHLFFWCFRLRVDVAFPSRYERISRIASSKDGIRILGSLKNVGQWMNNGPMVIKCHTSQYFQMIFDATTFSGRDHPKDQEYREQLQKAISVCWHSGWSRLWYVSHNKWNHKDFEFLRKRGGRHRGILPTTAFCVLCASLRLFVPSHCWKSRCSSMIIRSWSSGRNK